MTTEDEKRPQIQIWSFDCQVVCYFCLFAHFWKGRGLGDVKVATTTAIKPGFKKAQQKTEHVTL